MSTILNNVDDDLEFPEFYPSPHGGAPSLFAGIIDKNVMCWDADTGRLLWSVGLGRPSCSDLMFVRRAGYVALAVATWNGLRLWDAITGRELPCDSPNGGLLALAKFEGENFETVIVAASYFCEIVRWSGDGAAIDPTLSIAPVHAVDVQENAKGRRIIISSSDDETIRFWDLYSGEALGRPLHPEQEPVYMASQYLPNGALMVASSCCEGPITLWNASQATSVGSVFLKNPETAIRAIALTVVADQPRLIVSPYPGPVQIFDPLTGTALGDGPGSDFFKIRTDPGGRNVGLRLPGSRVHVGVPERVLDRGGLVGACEVTLSW
ncbi:hypothetical protein GCM10027589_54040 [Actinocorallia lasiicapitis]